MARKGGKRGGSSAARSAAAKKGWETRRRGGAKAKPAATKRTAASKPRATTASKPTARRGMPKTTSARGRALTNQRRAADLVRASRGGKGPSAKAVRSVLTAQRARTFYAATGGGTKRSAVKAKSAAKIGRQIRAQGRAKAAAARARAAGRPRAKPVSGANAARQAGRLPNPAARRPAAKLGFTQSDFQRRSKRTAGIRNPKVRETAQRLYGRILDLGSSPRQLRTMFRKAGKPKAGRKSAAQRASEREHRDMLALANRLF